MFYTHLTYIKKVCYRLFTAEVTAHLTLFSSLNVFVRSKVIHYHSYLVLIKYIILTKLIEFSYCYRRSNIVAEHKIKIYQNELSAFNTVKSSMCSQYFLSHCHSHCYNLLSYFCLLYFKYQLCFFHSVDGTHKCSGR